MQHDNPLTGMDSCDGGQRRSVWFLSSLALDDLRIAFTPAWRQYARECLKAHKSLRIGTTSVMEPSRTGGVDHSARAVKAGINPMIFGGQRSLPPFYCDPRRGMVTKTVAGAAGSWFVRRAWRHVAAPITFDRHARSLCCAAVTA